MADTQTYHLERLYYGILADGATRLSSAPGVIARTPNVTPSQVKECLRVGQLHPLPRAEAAEDMPGALALLQSNTSNFVLAKAQYNEAGYPQVLYILVPQEILRRLGGNLAPFRSLGLASMPAFAQMRPDLAPYELRRPEPPTHDDQIDAMLDLLFYCQDSLQIVEGVLAALIQGWPLAIVNSPRSLHQRLQFVQGLLSLLPVPARVGITFATHVANLPGSLAQIKFTTSPAEPPRHLIYDWEAGKLLTLPPDDAYSHYIVSQLRLDPSLVVEQTEQLARTTVWRAMQREKLGRVLAWVARRAAVDRTVRDGQPADRAVVASILREDPTLPNDLRQTYARHLLAFALALNEPDSADVIPMVAVTNPDIAAAVADQLRSAVMQGHAEVVYALLKRWLLRIPEASAFQWQTILHLAAERRLAALLEEGSLQTALDFMNDLKSAHPTLQMGSVLPALVRLAQPAARHDPAIAHSLFLLAVEALPAGDFQRLVADRAFAAHLPEGFRAALPHLSVDAASPAPPGLLARAAAAFGDEHRDLVLARLVEWAAFVQQPALIDAAGLEALLVMAQSSREPQFDTLIKHVVDEFSQLGRLSTLQAPGPQVLAQLLLQTQRYDQAIGLLERYQNEVYGAERLTEYTQTAGDVFRSTALPAPELAEALEYLEGSQIRPEPRATIFANALASHGWTDALDYAAQRLTTMIFNDPALIHTIGHDNALMLLHYHVQSESGLNALRVGSALIENALLRGSASATLVTQMWPTITWNSGMTQAAVELLRRYLRGLPVDEAPAVLRFFEREIGPEIARDLHATYLMRRVMSGQNVLEFAETVRTAAALLCDLAATYHADKVHPPLHRLRRDLDQMTGNLSETERKQIAENTLALTYQLYEMGIKRSRRQGRHPVEQQLIEGTTAPQGGVDLLRFIGGHFARQTMIPLVLDKEEMAHLFGSRSAAVLLRETSATSHLLRHLHATFHDPGPPITAPSLAAELDSLWSTLSLHHQRRLQDDVARSAQQLADVIALMADRANERVLANTGFSRQLETGQRQPHTALEAMRWISGYFGRKHVRR